MRSASTKAPHHSAFWLLLAASLPCVASVQIGEILPSDEDKKVIVTVRQVGQVANVTLANKSSYSLTYAYVGCNVDSADAMSRVGSGGYFKDVLGSNANLLHIPPGRAITKQLDASPYKISECFTGTLRGGSVRKPVSIDAQCRTKIDRLLGADISASVSPLGEGRYVAEYVGAKDSRMVRRTIKCIKVNRSVGSLPVDDLMVGYDD